MPSPDRQTMRESKSASADTGDFQLTAEWDADGIAALAEAAGHDVLGMSMPAPEGAPLGEWPPIAPWLSDETGAIAPPKTNVDPSWLDRRLADIAAKLEGTLREQDPAPALLRFGERLDNFEARVEAAVERASRTEDRDSLRFIEAHVREMDEHFNTMRGQIARLSAIDARVGDIWDHVQLDLPSPAKGLAGLVEGAVTRALAAASVLRAEAPNVGVPALSIVHLERIEDALGRLIERVEVIEEASAYLRIDDPRADMERLDAAYADGARALGGSGDAAAWCPVERGHVLHAEDYTVPARRRIHSLAEVLPAEPLAPPYVPETPAATELPAAAPCAEPAMTAADSMLGDLKQSVLRARERAHAQAADHVATDDEVAAPCYRPAPAHEHHAEPQLDAMPAILREESLGAGRSPSIAAKTRSRPLSQGRWNRGFFIMAGAMLALGGASFVVVEHLTSTPAEPVSPPTMSPTQSATRVAQPGREAGETKASPVALPPNTEIESPGAAARAASLPATIASASLRHAAANGEPAAEFEIGARFADGRGVAPDLQQAFVWYQRSAMHGYAPAQFRLGSCYERGLGTDKDLERAKLWYRRAAEKGHVKAMHNLAVLAAEATPKPDFSSAVQWFREAAERNLSDSQYNLAMLYETGRGVPENFAEAYKWYALALRNGDQEAARRMDVMRSRMSKSEIAAADKAVASWVPTPMYPMPGTSPSERAAP